MSNVVPYDKFKQRKLNRDGIRKPPIAAPEDNVIRGIPKPVPVLDREWDDEAFQYIPMVSAEDHYNRQRLLNRYFSEKAQGDPGDEA